MKGKEESKKEISLGTVTTPGHGSSARGGAMAMRGR